MVTGWRSSSATFKKCTAEKLTFVSLGVLDFVLTLLAVYLGFDEINPLVRALLQIPFLLVFVKVIVPVGLAWLAPGKLLIPSIVLLALIVIWNVKELIVFLV
ncbi:MAG: DUF5658 family protein [Dehalococcoidales bacterium]|jgi:hypothetical protein